MINHPLIFIVLVSTFLFSCGGGKSSKPKPINPKPINPKATTVIKSFSVKNTSINANINTGSFNFSWEAKSSDPYEVDIYVSSDAFLTDKKDIQIFGKRCGSSNLYDCAGVANFKCNFHTDNKIYCKDSMMDKGKTTDISSLLVSLPQTAYIIIEVCNIAYTSCKTVSKKVKFQ